MKELFKKLPRFLFNSLVFTAILVLAAQGAKAEFKEVVKDSNKNIVKNTFGNCVYTAATAKTDECKNTPEVEAPKLPEPAPIAQETIPMKPIKRSRSYLVFFDFNKSNLTPSAAEIVRKAYAEATGTQGKHNFSLTGHTDRSGSDAYNMKLSKSRVTSVKKELVKLGESSATIESNAKGESEPLVPTADGVKEAQNRRVEIIYTIGE